jgi:hypothetical protein
VGGEEKRRKKMGREREEDDFERLTLKPMAGNLVCVMVAKVFKESRIRRHDEFAREQVPLLRILFWNC